MIGRGRAAVRSLPLPSRARTRTRTRTREVAGNSVEYEHEYEYDGDDVSESCLGSRSRPIHALVQGETAAPAPLILHRNRVPRERVEEDYRRITPSAFSERTNRAPEFPPPSSWRREANARRSRVTSHPDLDLVRAAARLIAPSVHRTPVLTCSHFNDRLDVEIFFKPEGNRRDARVLSP